jgi:hypothetical protein
MCAPTQPSWWETHLAIPGFFLVAGALIGFGVDRAKAYYDEKKALKCFLRASRSEVAALVAEFSGLKADLLKNDDDVAAGRVGFTKWTLSLRTTVFDTQLGHLKDLSDPAVEKLIELYSEMSILPGALQASNDLVDWRDRLPREGEIWAQQRLRLLTNHRNLVKHLDDFTRRGNEILAVLSKGP